MGVNSVYIVTLPDSEEIGLPKGSYAVAYLFMHKEAAEEFAGDVFSVTEVQEVVL